MITQTEKPYEKYPYTHFLNYDRFKFVGDVVDELIKDNTKILDVGCAKGEFFYYLLDRFKNNTFICTGVEPLQGFIDMARQEPKLKNVNFICGDAETINLNEKFDIVIMQGVLGYFDELDKVLENLINHLNPGGTLLLFEKFNEAPVDTRIQFRLTEHDNEDWYKGYNMYSFKSINKFFYKRSNTLEFIPFKISVDLKPDMDNPLAGYTLNTLEKGKIVVNGMNIIKPFYLLKVTL